MIYLNMAYANGVTLTNDPNYNQSLGRSIEQRPMMINQRNRIGDFELDTVVGPRGHSKAVLLTLIDRKSQFLWAYRLKDRTTATVSDC